jgi:hypothetical protein
MCSEEASYLEQECVHHRVSSYCVLHGLRRVCGHKTAMEQEVYFQELVPTVELQD